MSEPTPQGGQTKAQRLRKDLLRRLTALSPGPEDVFVLQVPDEYVGQPEIQQACHKFCGEVSQATGRPVYLLTDRERLTVEPPLKGPAVDVPATRILLPSGVKLT